MRIAIAVDPEIPVPPLFYGGIERIVHLLIIEYLKSGHEVTLFAHPDSVVPCKLIPYPVLASSGAIPTIKNATHLGYHILKENFDIVHSFARLAYLSLLLPCRLPKIMSYQREPTLSQIRKAVKLSSKNSLFFTGCSDYISDQIKVYAKTNTVYNGVLMDKYTAVNKVNEDAPLIFLGRIEPIKGTHIAVDIALKTGKALIIAGNIPKEGNEYFEEKIGPFLSAKIQYIGPVDDDQKNTLLGASIAMLMPIQWNEPFGIVMAEALACGTPIIGIGRGSVPEVIKHGVNGFICDDVNEMINAVTRLGEINRNEVRKDAESRFSSVAIAQKYLDIYSEMINNR